MYPSLVTRIQNPRERMPATKTLCIKLTEDSSITTQLLKYFHLIFLVTQFAIIVINSPKNKIPISQT